MKTPMAIISSVLSAMVFAVALTGCGGSGSNTVSGYVPPILQLAQGAWRTPGGCELISNSSLIGSARFNSQFINNDYLETATYYSDDYCQIPEVLTRTQYSLTVGGIGPGGYGNQIDFYVRSVTMTPLNSQMAYDYNTQPDNTCRGGWFENVERDISPMGYCPIYNFSSSTVYTEHVGDLIRQIMDVDGNAIYMGARGGVGYPTYYNNSPSLVR